MLQVLKFGGSSLADPERMRAAANRIVQYAARGDRVVAVVSAQADTTDGLIAHAREFGVEMSPREMDAYLAAGEQMSAALMAMTLKDLGQEAISLTGWQAGLLTDGDHGDARILALGNDRIRKELDMGKTVIVAGFQGMDAQGNITTLGRGGSDTTAVALAAFLQADGCQIFTDVDGVYDKDPRVHPDAVRYEQLDYDTMLSMARNGAKVLHDRCVETAKKHGVQIQVLSSFREGPGTCIGY